MCNYALELSKSILNLEVQKNRVLERDAKLKRLCHCRREILRYYIEACQLLLVRTAARVVRYADDREESFATVNDIDALKRWFDRTVYAKMIEDPMVANKMVVMFQLIQANLDDQFFSFFSERYGDVVRTSKVMTAAYDDRSVPVDELFDAMASWFEASIFNALALKIDCSSISDAIYDDFNVPRDSDCCPFNRKENVCGRCEQCRTSVAKTEECSSMHDSMEDHEDIYLYIVDEMIGTDQWIVSFFDSVIKYHLKPKTVKVTLDFSLVDEIKMTEDQLATITKIGESFKALEMTNLR